MKIALAVTQIDSHIDANVRQIKRSVAEVAANGVDLVLFPESAVTGLINNDDPQHDLPLGQPIGLTRRQFEERNP